MSNQEPAVVFDKERASSYNERFAALDPIRDALHLLLKQVGDLSEFESGLKS